MPRCRRRYTWQVHFDDPLMAPEIAPRVRAAVSAWEPRRKVESGFSGTLVTGEYLGTMKVSVTIDARDRWQVSRLATRFARAIAASARVKLIQLGAPVAEKLPPHTHRGRYRWLGQQSPSSG